MRSGRLAVLVALALVTVAAPPSLAHGGVQGPNPLQNGEFTAAVPGTHVVPGWSMHSFTDPTEVWAQAELVEGDMKVRTLGVGGHLGGPTNLGFSMERPAYSLLFHDLTFEVTDLQGNDLQDTGLKVMILAEWTDKWLEQTRSDPTDPDPEPETSIAIFWKNPSSREAREGLNLANADGIQQFRDPDVSYEMSQFSDKELANEWTLGGVKISLPHGQQLLFDDFEMSGATLFGTHP